MTTWLISPSGVGVSEEGVWGEVVGEAEGGGVGVSWKGCAGLDEPVGVEGVVGVEGEFVVGGGVEGVPGVVGSVGCANVPAFLSSSTLLRSVDT